MRNKDWGAALSAYLAGRDRTPHRWGPNDCASFCADAGIGMGCDDLLAGLRGYKTERGALLKLRRAGIADLETLCRNRLPEVPVGMAWRGDVALTAADGPFGGALALFDGAHLVGPGRDHLERVPRALAIFAFGMR